MCGLVSGACFAESGANVTCVDKDENKINSLHNCEIPIYESDLDEIVTSNIETE
jgi:UDPglucose 6-dehydrogenase